MMHTENNLSAKPFFEKIWVKYGLIGGGIAILITVIYYLVDESLLTDPVFSFLPLISILVTAIAAAAALKKAQNNYLAYSQAVTTSLGSFSVGILLSTTFNVLLYYVIDTALLKRVINEQLKRIAEMVDKGKMPRESYDAVVKQMTEKGAQMFLFNLLLGVVAVIVVALLIFLISSAVLRREPKTQI